MAAVTINDTNANIEDSSMMNIEFVPFTTAASGDTFDCKKLREIESSFACQSTTDGIEIQCSFSGTRVTLTLSSGNIVTGYLVVRGRM